MTMSSLVMVILSILPTGNIILPLGTRSFQLRNVYHLPALCKNLLSVAKLTRDNNGRFSFDPNGYTISDLHTGLPLFQGLCKDGLYPLSPTMAPSIPHALAAFTQSSMLWHNCLGHHSNKVLQFLSSNKLLSPNFCFKNQFYKGCALGKSTQLPFHTNKGHATSLFHLVHSDVWMSPVRSVSGFWYYVLFKDEYTRYTWVYPMRRKSEVPPHFSNFTSLIKNQLMQPPNSFKVMVGLSMLITLLLNFVHVLVSTAVSHVPTHLNKMASLNVSTVISLR